MNDNYCLVLCYANWCGHCRDYYIKDKDGKEIGIDCISVIKKERNIPDDVKVWQEVKKYVETKCKVTQFEDEADFKQNKNSEFNLENMKPEGWPTIMMCYRENKNEKYIGKYLFDKNRTSLEDFEKFIDECRRDVAKKLEKTEKKQTSENQTSENQTSKKQTSENKTGVKQTGGSIDYRMKYKKYKQLYSDLVNKYNKLKHKTN